jgi:hypothetical protein
MYFKFKPRSIRNAVICCLLVPAAVLYICKKQVITQHCVYSTGHMYVLSIVQLQEISLAIPSKVIRNSEGGGVSKGKGKQRPF